MSCWVKVNTPSLFATGIPGFTPGDFRVRALRAQQQGGQVARHEQHRGTGLTDALAFSVGP